MNTNLAQMLKVSEGRYFTETEENLYKTYYEQLPARLKAMQELESKETSIVSSTRDAFFSSQPAMAQLPDANAKMDRDMGYLYRTAAVAMVQQDIGQLAEKAHFIFSIFANLGFPDQSMEQAYDLLRQQAQAALSADTWQHIGPYLSVLSVQRLQVWNELRSKQHALINTAIAYVLETWPQLKSLNQVEDHLRKDMLSLLAVVSEAQLAQSPEPVIMRKKWLYAFFATLRFDMDMVYQTYQQLPNLAQKHLSESCLEALRPWLKELTQP